MKPLHYYLILSIVFTVISCHKYQGEKVTNINIYEKQGGQPGLMLCIDQLDKQLNENSGIICYREYLWTINDSRGKPEIYAFQPRNGKIVQTIRIKNAKNDDWEDIAQDDKHIYIGDFGNNDEKRQKLAIYILKKKDIPARGNASLKASLTQFSYADKPDKESGISQRTHDCEAFFAWNDTLFAFTKNRENFSTTLYKIPSKPGKYIVQPVNSYPADGLITGADISSDGNLVVLSGYKDYVPFLVVFFDIKMPWIFNGKSCRLEFKDYFDLQVEGVAIRSREMVYIASEISSLPPQLYSIDISGITGN